MYNELKNGIIQRNNQNIILKTMFRKTFVGNETTFTNKYKQTSEMLVM